MGLFGFFKRRREQESAVQLPDPAAELGSFAKEEGVVGRQVGDGGPQASIDLQGLGMMDGLAMLSQLGPIIQKAIAEGNVTIEQGPAQTLDLRGTGLREEIVGIMKQHGIDPDGQTAANVDASGYGDMQQQILAALAKHGIDPGASGTSVDLQIKRDDD